MSELKRTKEWDWQQKYLEQLRRAQSAEAHIKKLEAALTDISNMCIGEIAMNYKLDAESIGELIYEATGKTNPELNAK